MVTMAEILETGGAPMGVNPAEYQRNLGILSGAQTTARALEPATTPQPMGAPSVAAMSTPAMTGMEASAALGGVNLAPLTGGLGAYMNQTLEGINDPALRAKYQGILTNAFSNLYGQGVGEAESRTAAYQAPATELLSRAQAFNQGATADVNRATAPSVIASNLAGADLSAASAGSTRTDALTKTYNLGQFPGIDAINYDQATGAPVQYTPPPSGTPGGDLSMGTPVLPSNRRPATAPQLTFGKNLPSFSSFTRY